VDAVIPDWTTPYIKTWQRWLADFVGRPHANALEVGSLAGRSTEWFCQNILVGDDCHMDVVDPWQGEAAAMEAVFDARTAPYPVTK